MSIVALIALIGVAMWAFGDENVSLIGKIACVTDGLGGIVLIAVVAGECLYPHLEIRQKVREFLQLN